MRVALIHPRLHVHAYDFFPLGLGHLAAALERRAIPYSLYDLHKDWLRPAGLLRRLEDDAPAGLFAVSAPLTSFTEARNVCRALKARFPRTPVVLGGRISVLDAERIFRLLPADYVVRGEGEEAIVELVDMLEGRRTPDEVRGLAYRDEAGRVRSNGEAALVENVSDYIIPYARLDIGRYVSRRTVQSPRLPSLNMLSSRGCPFSCAFCNFSGDDNHRMRYFDLDRLTEAWDYLRERHGLRHVTFNDDIFTVDRRRVKDICARLKERGIAFSCSTRVDCLDEESISVLEGSGCRFLCLGIESPSPTVSAVIGKRLDPDKAQATIARLKKTRMTVNYGFMIGHYGETEETIRETRAYVLRNGVIYSAFFAAAFPRTRLYDMVRDRIPDEDAYLARLSRADLSSDYLVNMTDMPKRRIYRLHDRLVADSVLNALGIRARPAWTVLRWPFVAYLGFMRRFGLRLGPVKRLFEFLNIAVAKPLAVLAARRRRR